MKTAVVCDWIISIGGAEKVLKTVYDMFNPDVFTLFSKQDSIEKLGIKPNKVFSSGLNRLPNIDRYYRNFLPLYPYLIEQFDLRNYDLVISLSHAVAKSVLTNPDQLHICYIYTPMRYIYDLYFEYLEDHRIKKGIKGFLAKWFIHKLRVWDYTTKDRPDYYIAISNTVAKRVEKIYNKKPYIIYPPVATSNFELSTDKDDYYITVSRLVPYKKVDIIVKAFNQMPDKKLVVVGDGPQLNQIKKIATKNISILGYQPFHETKRLLQKAKAFIFCAYEDFGIAPVEAMACGTPVISFSKGGASETIIDQKTGLFFHTQTPEAIIDAVKRFEKIKDNIDPHKIRQHSMKFDQKVFETEFKNLTEKLYKEKFG